MEKKILYVCLIVICAYTIFQNIKYNSMQYKNNFLVALKECIEVEDSCKGKVIENIKITNYNDKEDYLYNILSEYGTDYFLVIISSIESCSTCREHTLNIWYDLYNKDKGLPILLIVAEQDELSKKKKRQIKANIKGLHIEIPFYFDNESLLLDYLNVTPYQTPLSIILDHN
ncbi:MAG: hypothetical protein JSV88_33610, partial [Candidatus Aminicenantes bacterium]